ncbi:ankyrin repeat domain-containing protein [Wolbachia endosymbiont of Chironomus riparius]|uniref:ankyrin repeat domain-containing protein n=1 Tax=Wolbachia endosymbiont of Chironomus riparius TaxID=2883238 RepID=UPI0020A14846|nr:ankyrin repeat domain-containing protein [Wolbachia endosymbiont of Chironomus riparius]
MLRLNEFIQLFNKVNDDKKISQDKLIKKIKSKLKRLDTNNSYKLWKNDDFNINYRFTVINEQNEQKAYTFLHIATIGNCQKVIQFLLNKEAQIDVQDNDEKTPLHYAVKNHRTEIAELFITKAAHIIGKYILDIQDTGGMTPLHDAVASEQKGIIKLLIQNGAHIDIEDFQNKRTALHHAAIKGKDQFIELLLSNGAQVNRPDKHKMTPLHLAVISKNIKSVNVLLAKGAQIDLQDSKGKTALDYARDNNLEDIIKLLEKAEVKNNRTESRHNSVFEVVMKAVQQKQTDTETQSNKEENGSISIMTKQIPHQHKPTQNKEGSTSNLYPTHINDVTNDKNNEDQGNNLSLTISKKDNKKICSKTLMLTITLTATIVLPLILKYYSELAIVEIAATTLVLTLLGLGFTYILPNTSLDVTECCKISSFKTNDRAQENYKM